MVKVELLKPRAAGASAMLRTIQTGLGKPVMYGDLRHFKFEPGQIRELKLDYDESLFFVDASTDNIGIGINSPDVKWEEVVGETKIKNSASKSSKIRFRYDAEGRWNGLSSDPKVWVNSRHKDIPIEKLSLPHLKNIIAMLRRWAEAELDDAENRELIAEHRKLVDERCAAKCLQWPALIKELRARKEQKMKLKNGWYLLPQKPHLDSIAVAVVDGQMAGFGNLGAYHERPTLEKAATMVSADCSKHEWTTAMPSNLPFFHRENQIVKDLLVEYEAELEFIKPITHDCDGKPLPSDGPSWALLAGCLGLVGLVSAATHKVKTQQKQAANHVHHN